jgi:adenylate kinase
MGCPECGEIYHKQSKPPVKDMVCDKCGTGLTIRKDDQPETIRERLGVYHANTKPVIGYYESRGVLVRVNAALDAESVYKEMASGLTS